jgi:hypothetical protein
MRERLSRLAAALCRVPRGTESFIMPQVYDSFVANAWAGRGRPQWRAQICSTNNGWDRFFIRVARQIGDRPVAGV